MSELLGIMVPVMALVKKLGVEGIASIDGAWEYRIDEQWYIAVNGHDHEVEVTVDGMMSIKLSPYHFCIWQYGWIVAVFTPTAGVFLGDNEEELVLAIFEAVENMR